jgi:hypothetical protein
VDFVKSSKLNSAPGRDGIQYCVYRIFPFLLLCLMPILNDAASGCPPVQWCGSILQELFQGKGSPHKPSSYRDILLADVSGKLYRGILDPIYSPT